MNKNTNILLNGAIHSVFKGLGGNSIGLKKLLLLENNYSENVPIKNQFVIYC